MKLLLLLVLSIPAQAKPKDPPPPYNSIVWQIADGLSQPESALYDPHSKFIYISNVAGQPHEKDGKGWITKADLNGKVLGAQWVSGLNAPKGMRVRGHKLYVADVDEIVEIDVKKGAILRKIPVPGALLLNDLDTDNWGNLWVSDTMGSKIFKVTQKGEVETFAEGPQLESPNGLFVKSGKIFVAAWGPEIKQDWSTKGPGKLYALDLKTKAMTPVVEALGNLDGLEPARDGSWLVSDWVAGKVYRVSGGKAQMILSGFGGSADLGYIPGRDILLLPRMKENRVTAYRLSPVPKPAKKKAK
jgi:hypothetical protein